MSHAALTQQPSPKEAIAVVKNRSETTNNKSKENLTVNTSQAKADAKTPS